MKWITTFLAMVIIAVACEKAPLPDAKVAGANGVIGNNQLVGTWKMFTHYVDNGTGNGSWQGDDGLNDVMVFGSDGSFSCSTDCPLVGNGYDRYSTKGNGTVTLYNSKTGAADTYNYVAESPSQLLFYPHCRENCMRRYQRQ